MVTELGTEIKLFFLCGGVTLAICLFHDTFAEMKLGLSFISSNFTYTEETKKLCDP